MQQRGTHRRRGRGISVPVLGAVIVALAVGWLVGTVLARANSPGPAPAPVSVVPTTGPAGPPPPPDTGGFAQPVRTPTGLEVISAFTKVKGGVSVTVVAVNRTDHPVTVDTTSLGPHDVRFRGLPVTTQIDPRSKKLVPGEALSYPCRVTLPDMSTGLLSFTVDGARISGPAQGD